LTPVGGCLTAQSDLSKLSGLVFHNPINSPVT
jgi:hypothetical protein